MLDVRITAYIVPIAEQPQASLTPVISVQNYADEGAVITGLIRIYRESTGLMIYDSQLAITMLEHHSTTNIAALTPFDPPAPADDDYFIKADIVATSYLPGPPISATLGAWHFDIKTPPMGETPAGHHVTHEDGGSDEIDLTGLPGTEEFLRTDGANPLVAYLDAVIMVPPGNPAVNTARIYAADFKGFTFLKYRDSTGMVRQLVRDAVFVVRNNSGTPIPAMTPVYASGSSGNVPTIEPAKADAAGTMPAIGITLEIIADASFGRVMESGLMENVNTNAWNEGDELFIDAAVAGDMTITPPTYPNLRQEIAHVLVKGIGNGALQISHHSAFNDSLIDHDGLMNLDHDAHPQYSLQTKPQVLTDQAAIDWNLALGGAATVTLGGDRTLNEAANMVSGARYSLRIIQDGTGTRLLTWHATYRFPGGVDPALSAAAGNIDILQFDCDGTNLDCVGMVSAVA